MPKPIPLRTVHWLIAGVQDSHLMPALREDPPVYSTTQFSRTESSEPPSLNRSPCQAPGVLFTAVKVIGCPEAPCAISLPQYQP